MFEVPDTLSLPQLNLPSWTKLLPSLAMGLGLLASTLCIAQLYIQPLSTPVQAAGEICVIQELSGSITVYVSGAVKNPGIYALAPNTRLSQALSAAGGVTDQADSVYLQKQLNLAEILTDTQHVYVPLIEEHKQTTDSLAVGSELVAGGTGTSKVSVNTASQAELESLPRVGEKTAEKIIAGRPYTDLFQLVGTKVLSEGLYDEIEGMLSLWGKL